MRLCHLFGLVVLCPLGSVFANPPQERLLKAFDVDQSQPKVISLISMHSKLGDMVVTLMPIVHLLQQRYPQAVIRLYSPYDRLFVEGDRFEPKPMTMLHSQVPQFLRMNHASQLSSTLSPSYVSWVMDRFYQDIARQSDLVFFYSYFDFQSMFSVELPFHKDRGAAMITHDLLKEVAASVSVYMSVFDTPYIFYPVASHMGTFELNTMAYFYRTEGRPVSIVLPIHQHLLRDNVYLASRGFAMHLMEEADGFHSWSALKPYFVPPEGSISHMALQRLGLYPGEFISLHIHGGRLDTNAWPIFILPELIALVAGEAQLQGKKVALGHWDPSDMLSQFPGTLDRLVADIQRIISVHPAIVKLPPHHTDGQLHTLAIDQAHKAVMIDTGLTHVARMIDLSKLMTLGHEDSLHWQYPNGEQAFLFRQPSRDMPIMLQNDPQKHVLLDQVQRFLTCSE